MLLDAWEFLFKYPPLVFQKGRLALTPLPAWALVLAVLLAAIAAWAYLRVRGRLGRRDRLVLLSLRGALLALLLFALARPVLQVAVAVPQENYLGVLIDDSRSMRIAEGEEGARGAQAQRLLGTPDSALLRQLGERFRLRVFRFAGAAERVESPGELRFLGGQTRLGRAMEQARAELAGLPLAGLVVVTDGADQAEQELNASLLALRAGSVPVYTVGVGRERFARDVEVRRVSTPRQVLRGSSLVVDVVLEQVGYAGRTVPLTVEDGGRILSTQQVELPPDGTPAAVRVHFTAADAGWRRLRFRVPPQPGELVQQNNQREALVQVRDGRQKVLYVEGEPRFEVKFLRRAVEDDPQLQLVVLQRSAQDQFLRLGVDSAAELAGGFPRTREELFAYRAIVLGSVDAGFFTADQLRMLSDFVAERGGGLLALGGRNALSEGGYAGTALADVLPVQLEHGADTTFFTELKVTPTRAGLASAALRLAADPEASRKRWESLPPLSTYNRVTRLKPGATALLTGSGPGVPPGQVVLAWQRYGRGLAMTFAVQDAWLWQMHPDIPLDDQTHETLWRQLLRWLVNDTPGQLITTASTEHASPREPVSLRAQLRDAAFRSVNDARIAARVLAPDGSARELPLSWSALRDGEYQASFVPAAPGLHRVLLEARRGERTLAADSLTLEAVDDQGEFFAAQMRAPLLRRIAEETGGRFYTRATAARLPEEIRYSGQGVTSAERYDLWDMPIVFLLLVTLLAAEWGYRRLRGLP